ncbi:hypothetical protein LCGC14_1356330 [marine sediment metagenome]|uniref:Uncharacterized protein n=1 Tax=marine sediment metagenome TaxID=412755 RepID=A0A0F9KVK0_9ZZZZ
MKTIRNETRKLPVKLTDGEMLEQASELAHTIQEAADETDSQASLKAQMKARLMELDAKQSRLASVVATKTDYRDVEVEIAITDDGVAQETRKDTGEIISTRPLREDEKQLQMDTP